MRLREQMQLKRIPISEIHIETAPLETRLVKSLIKEEQKDVVTLYQNGTGYRIIDGKRRITALIENEQTHVLALILKDIDDREIASRALIANSGTPNPMDEAKHMQFLRDEGGYTGKEIAELIGYSAARVCLTLKLADTLIPELQEKVQSGEMKKSAAQKAADLPVDRQKEILDSDNFSLRNVSEIETDYEMEGVLFDTITEEIKPGLFLNYEKVKRLLDGENIEVEYGKEIFNVKRSE